MDFNIVLSSEGKELVAEASSPLGESSGRSAWLRSDERELGERELGERLFHRLLPGAVQTLYHRCRGNLASRAGLLRLRVRGRSSATAQELARIHAVPWELVHAPHGEGFLSLDPQVQLVRYLNLPAAVPGAFQVGSRELKVLIAIASPADQERLRWEAERAIIERAFAGSAVQVTILCRTTRDLLLAELAKQSYDVLHFIGHGDGPTGTLVLEHERGGSDWVEAQQLALIARGTASLRLVFLNACSTAEIAARSHKNLAASVGPALALRGVPAVVAMTSTIRDSQAITFARTVYTRLRDGATLEAAVHTARIAMRLGQSHGESWRIPVVFSRMAAGHAAENHGSVERSQYVVRTRVPELLGTNIEIAGLVGAPAGPVSAGAEDARADVVVDKQIKGETVTIAGRIDRGPGDRSPR